MLSRLCTVALSITAGYSPTLTAETLVYGVLLITPDAPYWEEVERGLREGATIEQATYYLQSPTLPSQELTDQDLAQPATRNAQSALELCNSMLERKPNALLTATPDAAVLSPCFKKAQWLNIPVIAVSDSIDPFHGKFITSEVLADHADHPYSLGVKAMQQASLAVDTITRKDAAHVQPATSAASELTGD